MKVIIACLLSFSLHAVSIEDRLRHLEIGQARIETKIDTMSTMMLVVVAAFASIVAVSIGFAIWDRRTALRPFENKLSAIELTQSMAEKDHEKLMKINSALNELAATDKKFASILRHAGLL